MDDLLLEYEGSKPATPKERERRRRLAATVTICGLAFVGIGQLSTGAWFTDTGTSNMEFATGDVQVSLNSDPAFVASGANTRTLVLNNITKMAPGDTEYQPVQVSNAGSLKLRYAVTGITVDTTPGPNGGGLLSNALDYKIYAVNNAGACATGVSSQPLLASTQIGTTETELVGKKATGVDSGDRELTAGTNEWLCVVASLDGPGTGNSYAKAKSDVTLTFYAEQTKNNP